MATISDDAAYPDDDASVHNLSENEGEGEIELEIMSSSSQETDNGDCKSATKANQEEGNSNLSEAKEWCFEILDEFSKDDSNSTNADFVWTDDFPASSSADGIEEQRRQLKALSEKKFKQSSLHTFLGIKKNAATTAAVQTSILAFIPGIQAKRKLQEISQAEKAGSQQTNPKRGRGRWKKEVDDTQPCPFYKIIPGTSFSVDAFKYGSVPGVRIYFLTHFHSDHYGGLNKWWSHGPIFCTFATARLVNLCLGVDWKWLRPVKMGKSIKILDAEVTFLPANHCPGSAIILLKLQGGKSVLHTGDFRFCPEMKDYPHLANTSIDTVYLDTTYCNPRYCFPLQEDVSDFAVSLAKRQLQANPKTLIAVGAYNVGKERIFLAMAEALGKRIFVEKRRLKMLACLDWPELTSRLTTDASSTPLHVLPLGAMNPKSLQSYVKNFKAKWNSVLGIRPTGWTYSEKIGSNLDKISPQVAGNVSIYGLPYSEHSSFSELRDCIQFLRPKKIIPTVNIGRAAEREMMQNCFKQWLSEGSGSRAST